MCPGSPSFPSTTAVHIHAISAQDSGALLWETAGLMWGGASGRHYFRKVLYLCCMCLFASWVQEATL